MRNDKDPGTLAAHHQTSGLRDRLAFGLVKLLRFFADAFFAKRYGHRAIVLETIAAIPGMVGGSLLHLKSLRQMKDDHGWIKILLDEAENERMHLMTFVQIEKPTLFERLLVIVVQIVFYILYFLLYAVSQKTAHRFVGYLEEEAVVSYTQYLELIDQGAVENVPAPDIARRYWNLPPNASLHDVVVAVRADEMTHRDINHCIANKLTGEACHIKLPGEMRS
jgi:ubiquinol oxidase